MNNKTALITGGAKRIGGEFAINLAKMGYDIVISYNNSEEDAKNLANKIEQDSKQSCKIFKCNLFDLNSAQKLADFMVKEARNWQLLVNNASIFEKNNFCDENFLQNLENNQNIHLNSPIILSKSFTENIINNNIADAQIINMIDKNITRFETKYFYYTLTKKSLANLTQMLALELAPKVRVNAIAPGVTLPSVDNQPFDSSNNPLEISASVDNLNYALNYLLNNKLVNGQILYVDGGANLNNQG